jgi:hypothetical protein
MSVVTILLAVCISVIWLCRLAWWWLQGYARRHGIVDVQSQPDSVGHDVRVTLIGIAAWLFFLWATTRGNQQ